MQAMDHLAEQCKKQLETFRIKELKDVLSRIGSGKQGKKQVLVDKIMAIVLTADRHQPYIKGLKAESLSKRHGPSREDLAKVIDDIYRTRYSGATDLATATTSGPLGTKSLIQSCELDDVPESKTRCPCGKPMDYGPMIQCEDCMVWQHADCVIIPEKEATKGDNPAEFYCEMCRIQYGDPFCASYSHPLVPSKTKTTLLFPPEGPTTMHNLEASFTLSHYDRDLLSRPSYDLQIWCVLLGDKVAFRMHWPLKSELLVNGVCVRVTNRPSQQLLGINGRDDGPVISDCTKEGLNRISFSAYDGRSFCLGVRIVHRRTLQQVIGLIPSEADGESFDTALSRVRRCIGGGDDGGDDSDSDVEVVSEWVTLNLRCPMSGSRIRVAGRFNLCTHIGCFDLHTFVELNQRARKWQCPICTKNYSLRNLIIDPFFSRIVGVLKSYGEDVTEVEIKPDGTWRTKLEGEAKHREPWRLPDGSITGENRLVSHHQGLVSPVKIEEGVSCERAPLKIGLKRNPDGTWEVNRAKRLPILENGVISTPVRVIANRVLSETSSATASHEDSSVNQEPNESLKQFGGDEVEANSKSTTEATRHPWANGCNGKDADHPKSSDIIVLSDTDEENTNDDNLGAVNHCNLQSFQSLPEGEHYRAVAVNHRRGPHHLHPETVLPPSGMGAFDKGVIGPLDLFGNRLGDLDASVDDDSSFWQIEGHNAPFEFLGSVSEDISWPSQSRKGPVRPTPVQAGPITVYEPLPQENWANGMLHTTNGIRSLTSADPSLRMFLPHQPAKSLGQPALQEPVVVSKEGVQDGWISLSLGGNRPGTRSTGPPYEAERLLRPESTRLDLVADSASALLDLSNHGARAAAEDESPTQRRTRGIAVHRSAHRQRNYFRVDSDSD